MAASSSSLLRVVTAGATVVQPLCSSLPSAATSRARPCASPSVQPHCSLSSGLEAENAGKAANGAFNRREALAVPLLGLLAASSVAVRDSQAAIPEPVFQKLCDTECEKELENIPTTTTSSGLQYRDIVVGTGPTPPVGFQVAANYVAMVPSGKVFDSSLGKGFPYIFRVGAGQVIKGVDEGLLTMKVGGIRRLYIPGELAYPKGLSAAAGRPRVPPSSPVIFDVKLLYVPGLDNEDE